MSGPFSVCPVSHAHVSGRVRDGARVAASTVRAANSTNRPEAAPGRPGNPRDHRSAWRLDQEGRQPAGSEPDSGSRGVACSVWASSPQAYVRTPAANNGGQPGTRTGSTSRADGSTRQAQDGKVATSGELRSRLGQTRIKAAQTCRAHVRLSSTTENKFVSTPTTGQE